MYSMEEEAAASRNTGASIGWSILYTIILQFDPQSGHNWSMSPPLPYFSSKINKKAYLGEN